MELKFENKNGFTVAYVQGRVDTTNYNEFEKQMSEKIEETDGSIIINCKDMNFISSSGLRVFLMTQKKLMGAKRKLHLTNMQPAIKEIFDISGFSQIFSIFNTEEEAFQG
ncbi:MAG TPA: STAS domain-containing protein [Bacteroidales bacterium]|nr:STAS domain-containing protein [Bacteroidales bacterium]